MSVTSTLYFGERGIVYAGLMAGDYFDGYPPPALLRSSDGGASFTRSLIDLSNPLIAALGLDLNGRVCAATNGNSLECFTAAT